MKASELETTIEDAWESREHVGVDTAGALREARRVLRGSGALGVTPEAASGSGPQLAEPWRGAGAALAWLSGGAAPLVPVAVFDDAGGRLAVRFGPAFTLQQAGDEESATAVMTAIAALLPEQLRGRYGADRADDSGVP